MKQIFIFPKIHSIVDFISSSSTELFITDVNQEVETIRTFLDDLSQVLGEYHGVGEIYVIDESNIKKVLEDFLIDYGSYYGNSIDIPENYEFEVEYFKKNNFSGWKPNMTKEEIEIYRNNSKSSDDAYNELLDNWIKDNKKFLEEKYYGRIIIEGESDNSIPYEIFDILENKFNCERFHLG